MSQRHQEWLSTSIGIQEGEYVRQSKIYPFHGVQYKVFSEIHYTCSHISYKIQIFQQLESRDYAARLWFINWYWHNIKSDCAFFNRILFSDERVFIWIANSANSTLEFGLRKTHMNIGKSYKMLKRYTFGQPCQ